jgi:alpha-galactosidase
MNETTLRRVADAMVSKGLAALGYNFLNLDDCWAKGRHANGTLYADTATFPSGTLKDLADYVHGKGLLFGTYTDRGTKTCAGRPAAQDHEALDAQTYADWGVDYLKEDSCNAPGDHATAFAQYGKMRDGLNKTGRPILFSLCGWNSWYAPSGQSLGNSWRIGPDDTNWGGILKNIDIMSGLEEYAGPGGWNDPCLLLSKRWDKTSRVTELQTRAQFSMWAVLAAPLLISGSILDMTAESLETYSNKRVIAVSQDTLGKQGVRILGADLASGSGSKVNVWARPLHDGSFALVFINAGAAKTSVTCGPDCFKAIGVGASDLLSVEDLWSTTALPDMKDATLTAKDLDAAGGHLMVVIKKKSLSEPVYT